ncbi:MAG: tyrosine--tRNA ligase [Rhodospirillaceae bacterium]|nr:tyrosine--tRNA ligase [Rhodospirillaceae bacterium]|tara:strand:+ start:45 stop:1310 length:1266 start_codon:yes stop_codon:yes gene_type:complete
MATFRSQFMHVLEERGFIHQCTNSDSLDILAENNTISAYIGFDCTANSLHVGSLVQIMMLKWLQKSGHKPIVLVGGGTSQVGDPSGRDESRKLLTTEVISKNKCGIKNCIEQFLTFSNENNGAIFVDNSDWLNSLEYLPFLRDIGRHFSVNRMLTFDSVKQRLEREQPLSFLEFNYMVLQAYDFLELSKRLGCRLQMGGSDQWGNIVNGVELNRRVAGVETFGLTTPLITLSSGAKMGKTAKGAIWLDKDMLSPYEYWQFWRNTDDKDVGKFLRLFTEIPLHEIQKLEKLEGAELNQAKKLLATEATTLCHGFKAAKEAQNTAHETFEKSGIGENLPIASINAENFTSGLSLIELMADSRYGLHLAKSKSEARRIIRGGGAKINNNTITDEMKLVTLNDFDKDGTLKISAGKKRHALVQKS